MRCISLPGSAGRHYDGSSVKSPGRVGLLGSREDTFGVTEASTVGGGGQALRLGKCVLGGGQRMVFTVGLEQHAGHCGRCVLKGEALHEARE